MIGIAGIEAAAGKADLPRMIGKVCTSLRQQQLQSSGSVDDRNEHGGWNGAALAAGQAKPVAQSLRGRRRGACELLREPRTLLFRRKLEERQTSGHLQHAAGVGCGHWQ